MIVSKIYLYRTCRYCPKEAPSNVRAHVWQSRALESWNIILSILFHCFSVKHVQKGAIFYCKRALLFRKFRLLNNRNSIVHPLLVSGKNIFRKCLQVAMFFWERDTFNCKGTQRSRQNGALKNRNIVDCVMVRRFLSKISS